jgi:hypothetical protein
MSNIKQPQIQQPQIQQYNNHKSVIKSIEKIIPANSYGMSMKQREHSSYVFIPTTNDVLEDEILNKEIINKCKINENK